MISQKKDWYFYDQFSMIFFYKSLKKIQTCTLLDTNEERKRTNELLLNYIHMFQLNF